MGKISEPPEIIGHSVATALVGTFLGVLLCYGLSARWQESRVCGELKKRIFECIENSPCRLCGGAAPQIAVEFGRSVIPATVSHRLRKSRKGSGN